MAVKWLTLPGDKIFFQADQQAFLQSRRRRACRTCQTEFNPFDASPPSPYCPICETKGIRLFDRLTIIAGRRWGKSFVGSIAGAEEACIPNTIGWACAPTAPKLHRYVIPAFQKLIPQDWVANWSAEHLDLRLKNGSLIHFQTLEHPDQGRGQGLDWLWIDEVCELTEEHWNVIEPSLGDKQGVAFFTTSPRSYDWVYKRLYKPAADGFITGPDGASQDVTGFWALHARTSDNPIFQTPEGREFLARQRATMPDTMFRQEYEADFVHFTGAVYGSLLDSQILRTGDAVRQILPEWPHVHPWRQVLVGLDSGADHPFGAVKLVATEKGFVVVGEYLERHKSFIEHAGSLKRLAGDSSIPVKWAMNKNERQAMIEFAQHGMYPMLSENEIVAGTERVKTWLHNRKLWFVEETVPKTIEQMRAYRWAETAAKDGSLQAKEKVYKKDDELPDCVRYALMTWPELPTAVAPDQQRDISELSPKMQHDIQRMRKVEDRLKRPEPTVVGDFFA